MCAADKEVRHQVINSHLPNRFSNCSTILQIKGARFHPFDITFLTESLKGRTWFNKQAIIILNKLLESAKKNQTSKRNLVSKLEY